jgi:hypothetical protein
MRLLPSRLSLLRLALVSVLTLMAVPAAFAQPVYTLQTVAGSNPLGDGGPR